LEGDSAQIKARRASRAIQDWEGKMDKKDGKDVGAKTKTRITDHKRMIVWQSMDELDSLVQEILAKIPRRECKIRAQIDSASDSVGANFVEGCYSGFLPEYIRFLTYSRRSLGELQERVRPVLRKSYINQREYEKFDERAGKTMYLVNRLIYSLKEKLKMDTKK
jgi:four helix bundle protein